MIARRYKLEIQDTGAWGILFHNHISTYFHVKEAK